MDKDHQPSMLERFTYIFSARQRKRMLLLCAILVVGALLETGTTALMLPFMNTVIRPETIGESSYRQIIARLFGITDTTDFLVLMSILLAGAYVVKAVYNMLSTLAQQRFIANVQTNLSARLFDCFMKKSYAYHLRHGLPEINQALTDVGQLMSLMQSVLSLLSEALVSLFMLVMLLSVNPMLTLVAAVLIVVSLLVTNRLVVGRIRKAGADARRFSILQGRAYMQGIQGLKGVKVNRNEQLFINRYAENNRLMCGAARRNAVLGSVPRLTVEAVSMAGIFLFMAYLSARGEDLDQMLPLFATFALAAVRLMPCATRLVAAYNGINYSRVSLEKVYENLSESGVDMQTNVRVVQPVPPLEKTDPLREGVRVEDVSFMYGDATVPLFEHVSLTIPAQSSVAFVGATGSGKTTMADLILGLHTPTGGRVTADGHDVHKEPAWWARRVGYVPQSIYLCDDTVASNVAFGQESGAIDEARVWDCLEQAQMKAFVQAMPQGLQTVVGDNGIRLSGGQRQRIGIARALYLDPQMLVLDEATSSLDNDTEEAIIEAVNHLSGHKTLLIIAHRLTTIRDCNIVYRIEDGKVSREK